MEKDFPVNRGAEGIEPIFLFPTLFSLTPILVSPSLYSKGGHNNLLPSFTNFILLSRGKAGTVIILPLIAIRDYWDVVTLALLHQSTSGQF